MAAREVRITLGWSGGFSADRETALELVAMFRPGSLHLRAQGGRQVEVIALRADLSPSSHAAVFALIEEDS